MAGVVAGKERFTLPTKSMIDACSDSMISIFYSIFARTKELDVRPRFFLKAEKLAVGK